jgi:hypothetical protein
VTDVSGHPGNRALSAYSSGHGSMINGNALSRQAPRPGRPAFRNTKHPSEDVCVQDTVSPLKKNVAPRQAAGRTVQL